MKWVNPNPSTDTGQTSDEGTSHFQIFGQSLIKENSHNSRTSDDTDMKLGPATKLYKKHNCDVIVIFPIYCKFRAIRKPDSGQIVCKTYIFINSKLLSYKN